MKSTLQKTGEILHGIFLAAGKLLINKGRQSVGGYEQGTDWACKENSTYR